MMKHVSLLMVLLLSVTLYAQKEETDIKNFTSELDMKIPKLLNDFMVPGTAIAIIENGEVIIKKGYGWANVENGIKVSTSTGFNIGSISKTIAAWGVLKLVEEGKIDLDVPAQNYLTRWYFPPSEFDASKITVRMLLSHTAGLSLHGYPGWSSKEDLPTIEESLDGKNNGPGRVEIIMEPGSRWKYSGGGFTILQLIIEEVAEQNFEDYMQEEILIPLGMTNSSYSIDEQIMKASSLEHSTFGEVINFEHFTAKAAAGLHTTIDDFTKFVQASLYENRDNKQTVLSMETLEEMMEPVPVSNGSYGLGYQVESIPETSLILKGHGGANEGWHSYFRVDPETNDGFIVITNGGAGHELYRQLFCDWVYWKTGKTYSERCTILPPIAGQLKQIIDEDGVENLEEIYTKLQHSQGNNYNFSESQLNQLGYHYLTQDELKTATEVFKMNIDLFPNSGNAYDSYGEVLLKSGDKEKAIDNYRKAVELNPGNEGAIHVLNTLGIDTEELTKVITIDDLILQSYVGRYEISPEFVITISKDGSRMYAQPEGQGELEIHPKAVNTFYLKEVAAQVIFNSNQDGLIESMTLIQDGQEMTGLKMKE